jgi:uncharacterized membrane protein YgcG
VAETRQDQQKLWLILFQIKGVRARLNFLALQRTFFGALAFLVGGAALVWGAAVFLTPLPFLVAASVIVMFALVGMVREGRRGLRELASPERAAALADRRASLKGRLATVLALAEAPRRSPLWPYLVEDAYGLRDDFAPARIEPRWISRSVFGLFAACLVAVVVLFSATIARDYVGRTIARGGPGRVTADIGDLEIRPADPALEPNAEIYADEKTLRKLEHKLAASPHDRDQGGLSRWMNKARNLAGNLQSDLTGRKGGAANPLQLQLSDKNPGQGGDSGSNQSAQGDSDQNGNPRSQGNSHGAGSAGDRNNPGEPPTTSMPGAQADQLAQNNSEQPAQAGPNAADPGDFGLAGGGSGGGGGANHGAGSDPNGLFGPDSSRTLGTDNFKITIEAEASDESSTSGAPAYIPPRVRVPLNPNQSPDEPLERGSVPSADQAAIKRVFQR